MATNYTTKELDILIENLNREVDERGRKVVALKHLVDDRLSRINVGDCFRQYSMEQFFPSEYLDLTLITGFDKEKGKMMYETLRYNTSERSEYCYNKGYMYYNNRIELLNEESYKKVDSSEFYKYLKLIHDKIGEETKNR